MAAEEFGGFDPLLVLVNGFLATGIGAGSKGAFSINHDENVGHAEIGNALLEFTEVGGVLGFVFEELVDVFEGGDAVGLLGVFRPGHVVEVSLAEGTVVGPLGEGDVEEVLGFGSVIAAMVVGESGDCEGGESRVDE